MRRSASVGRLSFVLCAVVLLCACPASQQPPAPFRFGPPVPLTTTALAPADIISTPNGEVLSILLQNFFVSLEQGAPEGSAVASVRIPLQSAPAAARRLRMTLRGALEKGAGSVARIIATVDGTNFPVEFDRAKHSGPIREDVLFTLPHGASNVTVTFTLYASRSAAEEPLRLDLDSVDIAPVEHAEAQ